VNIFLNGTKAAVLIVNVFLNGTKGAVLIVNAFLTVGHLVQLRQTSVYRTASDVLTRMFFT
jgi:hypothetical protein